MKLHADAAASLKQRQLLVSRVVEDDWPPAAAAAAAAVSERRAGACVRRFKPERELGLLDRSSGAKACRQAHARGPRRDDCGAQALADDGRGARRAACDDRLRRYCGEFSSPSDGKSPQ